MTTQNVPPKAVPITNRTKSGQTTTLYLYNIAANQQLQGFCNEELRMADYRANSKGASARVPAARTADSDPCLLRTRASPQETHRPL